MARRTTVTVRTDIRLPVDMAAALDAVAAANMRSLTAEVTLAVMRYVAAGTPASEPPTWERGALKRISSVRIPRDVYDRLAGMAHKARRSINQEIVLAVSQYLETEAVL